LADEGSARGAEGLADGDFFVARRGAREEEVGEISARNEEGAAHGAEEDDE
jgi:hypothetical protein